MLKYAVLLCLPLLILVGCGSADTSFSGFSSSGGAEMTGGGSQVAGAPAANGGAGGSSSSSGGSLGADAGSSSGGAAAGTSSQGGQAAGLGGGGASAGGAGGMSGGGASGSSSGGAAAAGAGGAACVPRKACVDAGNPVGNCLPCDQNHCGVYPDGCTGTVDCGTCPGSDNYCSTDHTCQRISKDCSTSPGLYGNVCVNFTFEGAQKTMYCATNPSSCSWNGTNCWQCSAVP